MGIKDPIINQSIPFGANQRPTANLIKNDFDSLVWNKGYDVIKETGLKCPCKSKTTNQQSNCKNCGGSGWLFINPTQTKMVLTSMNRNTQYKEWSEESIGNVSITALSEEHLSFMDRVTVLDGNSIFSEVLFMKKYSSEDSVSSSLSVSNSSSAASMVYYFKSNYDIKELLYIAIFNGTQNKLVPLIYGEDFIYKDNRITFLTAINYINPLTEDQDISITVRYKHSPQFYIVDIPRETMQTNTRIAGVDDNGISMPIHAIGRRSHYVLDDQNFEGNRVFNNDRIFSFNELNPPSTEC